MLFSRSKAVSLPLALILGGCVGCGASDAPAPSAEVANTASQTLAGPSVTGPQTFVIVPERSKASYHATEEFFADALAKLGIKAGRIEAVGSTQAIEGQFKLDPERPTASLGENSFVVQLNTLTSDQTKRDAYIREIRGDGPSFDAHPAARFKATAIDGNSNTSGAGGRELNLTLTGDLTVRDITKRVVFDVKAQLTGDTLTGVGTTRFLLSDFSIGPIDFPPLLTVADAIGIEVQFTARARAEQSK